MRLKPEPPPSRFDAPAEGWLQRRFDPDASAAANASLVRWSRCLTAAFAAVVGLSLLWVTPWRPSLVSNAGQSVHVAYAVLLLGSASLTAGTAIVLRLVAR